MDKLEELLNKTNLAQYEAEQEPQNLYKEFLYYVSQENLKDYLQRLK